MASITMLTTPKRRLLVAAACGLVAALLITFYTSGLEAQATQVRDSALAEYGGTRIEVLTVTRDVAAGESITSENATMQPWLANLLPEGAFTSPDAAYGQAVSMPIYKNEPVLSTKLTDQTRQIEVPDGLCALSIPVTDEMAVGGALVPGSAVDVYAIGAHVVSLVVADVLVLESSNGYGAAASSTSSSPSLFGSGSRTALKWVTLAVQPEMVTELLTVARDKNLSLVLPGLNTSSPTSAADVPADSESGAAAPNTSTSSTSTPGASTGSATSPTGNQAGGGK
ncbi:MAG: Flp pilus assembly protein CpaB [Coriobacteriales bacterium]|jgi:pilus assembly protein CpaB|nr:Flp pilus assembly protein CpaB [Coriobacteriales bacterium]